MICLKKEAKLEDKNAEKGCMYCMLKHSWGRTSLTYLVMDVSSAILALDVSILFLFVLCFVL